MRSKTEDAEVVGAPGEKERLSVSALRERIRADLARRGVSPEFADAAIAGLEAASFRIPRSAYHATVNGVALAWAAHERSQEQLRQGIGDLRQLHRLMDDFGGELKKLDEAVKILAATLGRMRKRTGGEDVGTLH